MSVKDIKRLIEYWVKSAGHDFITMESLFRNKRYSDALFYGHIVLEKVLKALAVLKTKKQAKYTHNLLVLAEDAGLSLTEEDKELLVTVNNFNIRACYPDIKFAFYKLCTCSYTQRYLKEIKKFYQKLCRKIKSS